MQFDFPCISLVVFMTGIAKCVGWSHEAIAALITLFRLHFSVILITIGVLILTDAVNVFLRTSITGYMILDSGIWAAIDSSKIQLRKYPSGISYAVHKTIPPIKSNFELTRPIQIQKLLSHTNRSSSSKRHPVALDSNKDVISNPEVALLDYLLRPTVIIVVVVVKVSRRLLQPDNCSSSSKS